MEDRPHIHYSGNTVKPLVPDKRSRQMIMRPQREIKFAGALPPLEEKICAVSKCVWCGYRTDQYFITCPMCRNCQYCGYVDEVDPNRCFLCGNYLPENLHPKMKVLLPE